MHEVFILARTESQIQADITKYEAARDKILNGQDLGVGDKRLIRPRLRDVQAILERLYGELAGVQYGCGARNVGIIKRS